MPHDIADLRGFWCFTGDSKTRRFVPRNLWKGSDASHSREAGVPREIDTLPSNRNPNAIKIAAVEVEVPHAKRVDLQSRPELKPKINDADSDASSYPTQ